MPMKIQKMQIQTLLCYTSILSVAFSLYLVSVFDLDAILIIMIVILGSSPLFFAAIRKNSDALSPEVVLPFTYMLFALGPMSLSSKFSSDVITYYLFLQLMGLLAMCLGLHIAARQRKRVEFNHSFDTQEPRTRFLLLATAIGMLLLSCISLATYFNAFGGLAGYINVGYGGQYYLIAENASIIGPGFEWLLLGSILLIYYGIKYNSKSCLLIGIVLISFATVIILITGRRRQILYPFLFGIMLFHYSCKKIPSPVIAGGLLFGISIAQYYALARYYLPKGLIYALSQVWPVVLKNPVLIAPWSGSSNQFVMPAASLLEVLQYGGPGFLWGSSYIASLAAPFPFVIRLFSEVSFDVSKWRMETLYPNQLAAGIGFTFSPVTEGYVNFGLLGIILHLFLYGYIIGTIYARLSSKSTLSNLLLFAGSAPVFLLDGMCVASSSAAYTWTRIYLMPWIIYWGLKIVLPRSYKQHSADEDSKMKELEGKPT